MFLKTIDKTFRSKHRQYSLLWSEQTASKQLGGRRGESLSPVTWRILLRRRVAQRLVAQKDRNQMRSHIRKILTLRRGGPPYHRRRIAIQTQTYRAEAHL